MQQVAQQKIKTLFKVFFFYACDIIKYIYNKSPKTCPIRLNFSIKHLQCIGIQAINSYAI